MQVLRQLQTAPQEFVAGLEMLYVSCITPEYVALHSCGGKKKLFGLLFEKN